MPLLERRLVRRLLLVLPGDDLRVAAVGVPLLDVDDLRRRRRAHARVDDELDDDDGRHQQREREHLIGAALAVLITAIIIIEFFVDAKINTAPPPQVVEVQLYAPNRTDAEIIADQKKDQAAKEAALKERQRQFQKLEKKLGM